MNFPLLNLFLTMMWLFLWILWIFLLIRIAGDIFRSEDLSGWGRAAWLILVIVLPYLGVFAYVISRGGGMGRRENERVRASEEAMRSFFQEPIASSGRAQELTRLADLRDKGVISDAEFAQGKAKILA